MSTISAEVNHKDCVSTKQYLTTSDGWYDVYQVSYSNGRQDTHSAECDETLVNTLKKDYIKGDHIKHCGGNDSQFTAGLQDHVVGSQSLLVGTPYMFHMSPQEKADLENQKNLASRIQSKTVPDDSLFSQLKSAFKPAPDLGKLFASPPAEDLQDTANDAEPPTFFGSIAEETIKYAAKVAAVTAACTPETLKEAAKIQAKYTKEQFNKTIQSRKKMWEKLSPASKESLANGMGKALCPGDGKLSFKNLMEGAQNGATLLQNPALIASLAISPTSDPDTTPQKEFYDRKTAQSNAAEAQANMLQYELQC